MAGRGPLSLVQNLPATCRGSWTVHNWFEGCRNGFPSISPESTIADREHRASTGNCPKKPGDIGNGPWTEIPWLFMHGREREKTSGARGYRVKKHRQSGPDRAFLGATPTPDRRGLNSLFLTNIWQFETYLCDKSYKGTQGPLKRDEILKNSIRLRVI